LDELPDRESFLILVGSVIGASTMTVSNSGKQPKTKPMKTDFYEMTYILSPVMEEDDRQKLVDSIAGQIKELGGTITEQDEWGTRSLAYEIDKKKTGYYVNLYFDAPHTAIKPVERSMQISDFVMRYMTLKYDAKMKRHYELRKSGNLPRIFESDEEITKDQD